MQRHGWLRLGRILAAAACFELATFTESLAPKSASVARAEDMSDGPGTLFRWSYGDETGGPPGYDEPLVSDRPDFTEASTTVGRGVAQVEMGYTYTYDNTDGVQTKSHSYPEMLWRVGAFADWFELRLAFNVGHEAVSISGQPPTNNVGAEDLYLGLKLGLTPQDGILPEMALMPQMTVPLGSELSNDIVLPGLNWLYGWDINDFLSTGGSTQANKSVEDNGNIYVEVAQSWTVGYSLTEKLGAYTEWFAFFPSGADEAKPEHYFDGGFTYSVNNNLQLDIRAGVGLNDAADDYFLGSGFVKRF